MENIRITESHNNNQNHTYTCIPKALKVTINLSRLIVNVGWKTKLKSQFLNSFQSSKLSYIFFFFFFIWENHFTSYEPQYIIKISSLTFIHRYHFWSMLNALMYVYKIHFMVKNTFKWGEYYETHFTSFESTHDQHIVRDLLKKKLFIDANNSTTFFLLFEETILFFRLLSIVHYY